ncbi:MAG: hypothetical protein K6T73_01230 [Candidatus Bathyarchaeota archaeon]|nr:hypothetical protein [Candidatus Bathyarchaeota archaeon]
METSFNLGNLLTIVAIIVGLLVQYTKIVSRIQNLETSHRLQTEHMAKEIEEVKSNYTSLCKESMLLCKTAIETITETGNPGHKEKK